MKKTRLLIALLVMLVAASGYAQDSYREAVKQYLNVDEQFEQSKAAMETLKMLFVNDDKVDLDQLNERYLKEQFVDDYSEHLIPLLQARNITEADLQEVYSLLSTPQGKTYSAHMAEWQKEVRREMMKPMFDMFEAIFDMEQPGEGLNLQPIQPNADIDAAFAAKMTKILDDLSLVQTLMEKMDELSSADSQNETSQNIRDWFKDNVPVIALNAAYVKLTDEDLDYVQMLLTKESFCKFKDFSNISADELNSTAMFTKYLEWMKAQGATVNEDPAAAMEFLKALMGDEGIDFNFDNNEYIDDIDLGDRKSN